MKLLITNALLEDMQPAIEDALRNAQGNSQIQSTDQTYLKIQNGRQLKRGVEIEADEDDLKELVARGHYKIEVAKENLSEYPSTDAFYYRGQVRAWEALIRRTTDVI